MIFGMLFSCPSMEWAPRTEAYPYGTYVEYLGKDYVAQLITPGTIAPEDGQNSTYWIYTFCSEPAIPNDSSGAPGDTTETDTTQVDTTNLDLYYNTQATLTNNQVLGTLTSLIATAVFLASVGFAVHLLISGYWLGRDS